MKESRNILGWISMEEEQTLMRDAEKHVDEICKTVEFLSQAVQAYVKGDLSAKTIAIENVRESEHAADIVRSKMIDTLYEGLLVPADREDLLRFVKTLDKVADWTNSAARLLGFIDARLPESIMKNISISTELIVDAVAELKAAIYAASSKDFKKTAEKCSEVDRLEHSADDQKRATIEAIILAKLDPTTLLLTYNLAEALEGVTDKVGSVSDLLRLYVMRTK